MQVSNRILLIIFAIIHFTLGVTVEFDLKARDIMLVYFFTTIGLNSNIMDLIKGGKPLIILLSATILYMIIQNAVGIFTCSPARIPTASRKTLRFCSTARILRMPVFLVSPSTSLWKSRQQTFSGSSKSHTLLRNVHHRPVRNGQNGPEVIGTTVSRSACEDDKASAWQFQPFANLHQVEMYTVHG
jgi:hypothetical protein